MTEKYQPNWQSLSKHQPAKWFMDAKFGIFVHWGVYSVPAWAPTDCELDQYTRLYENHPYAEIYMLCMKFKNSPFWKHHRECYGGDFHYDDFIPMFKAEKFDADEWGRIFRDAGAKYSVMVTKHSDDFAMFPTAYSDRNAMQMGPKRDLVDEFCRGMRKNDLKVGLYYTWAFNTYYSHYPSFPYTDYIHGQGRELIDRYHPDLFWPDAEYAIPEQRVPASVWDSEKMIAYYYNQAENPDEVLVNDRWGRIDSDRLLGDYMTPEYYSMKGIPEFYWETTRGIGRSFGYNQMEGEDDYSSVKELVHLLIDNVSKNGNLLLNVGPKADGTICDIQLNRLRGIGRWLRINGEAIYGTRHWVTFEGQTDSGIDVRYTRKNDAVYAILLERPVGEVRIRSLFAREGSTVRLLDGGVILDWHQDGADLAIRFPESMPDSEAYAVEISTEPLCLLDSASQPRVLKIKDLQRMGFKPHW